jgi:hypothetical protein
MSGFGAVFQASPGVISREIDLSNIVPGSSSSVGGFAGEFNWGQVPTDVSHLITVGSEKDLISNFGKPSLANAASFFTAASFFNYGSALKVARAISDDAVNAVDSGTAFVAKNLDHFNSLSSISSKFIARYPGTFGNSLRVSICSGATAFDSWEFASLFDYAPGSTEAGDAEFGVADTLRANDEIHVVVIDKDGLFTGTKGTVLERYSGLSVAVDAKKFDGTNLYYKSVINAQSAYIYVGTDTSFVNAGETLAAAKAIALALTVTSGNRLGFAYVADVVSSTTVGYLPLTDVIDVSLSGGVDGTLSLANSEDALDFFKDSDIVDVSLLFAYPFADSKLYEVANYRKDLVGFISAPLSVATLPTEAAKLAAVLAKFRGPTYGSSSYIVFDSGPLYVYDKYHDAYVWIPACGHMAGLCANTDFVADPWFSPAGPNRGNIFGVTKLGFNPSKASRDELFKNRINPIVAFPGEGILLFGDKTAQTKPSAFDHINVRRLFNVLKKSISKAARYQLFELNDEFTRALFKNMTEPFLRDIKGRRGITDFAVICDSSNNTPQVIDTNNFVAEIYVAPARSINGITLNFVATRTGVNFSEIVKS